jgi:hypothetical protein
MIVSEDIFVMLLTRDKFKTFTPNEICDATKSTEVLCVCLVRAEIKSMSWFARPSPRAEPLTTNHKITGSCMDMDFRTPMATFGN